MSSVQTLENPPEHNEQDDPPEVPATNSRGKATKTTFRVYANGSVLMAVEKWADSEDANVGDDLLRALPRCVDVDDLIHLGSYDATSRDDAVEQMIADERSGARVRLVQLTYAAHVDMWFPVLSVASGYVKDVPAVWEINPVSRIGGR
jgi:hypothetical protein